YYPKKCGKNRKKGEKYIVSSIEDPDNVNKRRAEIGLGPISDYVKNWGIIWNLEEYKKEQLQEEK
ncbi:MAG TPA: hypothetical protein P5236_05470, partial [Paludibacteraceae bacterium]|nr:hypothetical protein [Paludibacteraceae bacterium]